MQPMLTNTQITHDVNSHRANQIRGQNGPQQLLLPATGRLNQLSKRFGAWSLSPGCINGIYHAVGNVSFCGAFAGVALLTTADLGDRQKDAVGGLTMALIALGAISFWNLACCSRKNQNSNSDGSVSDNQSMQLRQVSRQFNIENEPVDAV